MILTEFPDLKWLKEKAEKNFADKKAWNGQSLEHSGWPTVVLNTKANFTCRDNIRGPLSIFVNLSGESYVEAEKKKVNVKEGFFFVTNPDQYYTLAIDKASAVTTETFNIHFGENFAEQVFSSLYNSTETLLEEKYLATSPIEFYNKLNPIDATFRQLLKNIRRAGGDKLSLEENLYALGAYLLSQHKHIKKTQDRIPVIKNSTREEIIKRLHHATDFIYTLYSKDISLDDLAAISCLSKFHFLRLFKVVFNQTPHQFINRVRVERAKDLLKNSSLEIHSVAKFTGFANASSFSRMFYNQTGIYPSHYRK